MKISVKGHLLQKWVNKTRFSYRILDLVKNSENNPYQDTNL